MSISPWPVTWRLWPLTIHATIERQERVHRLMLPWSCAHNDVVLWLAARSPSRTEREAK